MKPVRSLACVALAFSAVTVRAQQQQPVAGTAQTQTVKPSAALDGKGPSPAGLPHSAPAPAPGTQAAPLSTLPDVVPAGRPSIALVLDGGGALGLAHIGVLEWFEDNHVPIDRITGASMGALVGGLYAEGHTAREVAAVAEGDALNSVFKLESNYRELAYRRREDRRELPQAFQLGLRKGVTLRNSLLIDNGLNAFLADVFSSANREGLNWNTLPIPFRCVATDLTSLRPVVYSSGSIARAVRASVSLPGVFAPIEQDGHYLIDGGVVDNLPTDLAKNDLKADVIIAVILPSADITAGDVGSIVGVLQRAFSAEIAYNEAQSLKLASIVIEPQTKQFTALDYEKAKYFIETGYAAAETQRTRLAQYRLDDDAWRAYIADKLSRRPHAPVHLDRVQVRDGNAGARAVVRAALAPVITSSSDGGELAKNLNTALDPVMSDGRYQATYQFTASGDLRAPAQRAESNGLGAQPPSAGNDRADGVRVTLREAGNGPPYLLAGTSVTAESGNVTRATLDLRLTQQDFGGYGSELRSDLRLGFLTDASTEYYRLLSANGFYVKPRVEIVRQPVYIYENQRRIQERFEQNAGGSLDVGRTFSARAQAGVQWTSQVVRWDVTSGSNGEPAYSGGAHSVLAHYHYDGQNAALVSTAGVQLQVSAGYLYNAVASENAPVAHLQIVDSVQAGKNLLGVQLRADTYFRRDVADPLRFTLGGPLTLGASNIDEYRVTDDMLFRGAFLRQIASLPVSVGQGLYAVFSYEGGEMWSPERKSFLREDGTLGILAATPLGAITLGAAVGDAGHRKIFFTFGRLF